MKRNGHFNIGIENVMKNIEKNKIIIKRIKKNYNFKNTLQEENNENNIPPKIKSSKIYENKESKRISIEPITKFFLYY